VSDILRVPEAFRITHIDCATGEHESVEHESYARAFAQSGLRSVVAVHESASRVSDDEGNYSIDTIGDRVLHN